MLFKVYKCQQIRHIQHAFKHLDIKYLHMYLKNYKGINESQIFRTSGVFFSRHPKAN